jgi:hypothetical protein
MAGNRASISQEYFRQEGTSLYSQISDQTANGYYCVAERASPAPESDSHGLNPIIEAAEETNDENGIIANDGQNDGNGLRQQPQFLDDRTATRDARQDAKAKKPSAFKEFFKFGKGKKKAQSQQPDTAAASAGLFEGAKLPDSARTSDMIANDLTQRIGPCLKISKSTAPPRGSETSRLICLSPTSTLWASRLSYARLAFFHSLSQQST